ncbi:xanthine dehydrogenase family protein subunit M [Candidatus Bipolaricaulota bacterium]|nr:xanthine dehydrogenase family protein subunit M [Candidatus Bipolaricaulota bacterium]
MGFELLVPENKDELFTLMAESNYYLLAGGTDLFVKIEKDLINPDRILDLTNVIEGPKLEDKADKVRISATATHGELAGSPLINREFPLLAESAESVGGVQLRNMATVGGNICNASPSADTLIALYALDASLKLESRNGSRTLPIDEFIKSPGETDLGRGEFLKSITIPKLSGNYRHFFNKVGRRNALDISVCSMGFVLKETDGKIEDIRISFGAVAPKIVRPDSVENYLKGKKLTRKVLPEAKDLLKNEISPISDIRGSAEYRKQVAVRSLEEVVNS